MTQDTSELRELLDDGKAVAEQAGEAGETLTQPKVAEPSPTVLTTDKWTKRAGVRLAAQWREMLGESGETNAHVDKMCDPNVAADAVETLLSGSPKLAEKPEDQHRATWWDQLLKSPETTALRSRTVANAALAEIAASEVAGTYARYAIEHPPKPESQDGEGEGQGTDNESPEDTVARMRSTRSALKAAAEAVDTAEMAAQGLGAGSGEIANAGELAKYTQRLRRSPSLAAIMRMAGRFIAKANRLQRQRTDFAGMEITGVELSGDLSRVLPGELALIAGAVPELETLALLNLVENRALSYKRIRREPKAMGPIVVSIDESGSMQGDRIAAAKGLALAMASIARAQKRPFMLVAWADMFNAEIRTVRGDAGPDALIEWLEQFDGGGTNLRGPLWTLTTAQWPEGPVGAHADHIIITDGEVGIEPWLLSHYQSWAKGTNVRTFGIGIGVRSTDTLAEFCDGGVWKLPNLDLDNAAVDVVLSIGPQYK